MKVISMSPLNSHMISPLRSRLSIILKLGLLENTSWQKIILLLVLSRVVSKKIFKIYSLSKYSLAPSSLHRSRVFSVRAQIIP
ncbi:hypothetical protein [African swine fever virus]|uniref:Uncharacterized protein n=1 Tax=African swine fever virus TaxID=10497 RepID=A0A3G1EUV2_ASF|nr:hypothetical protein F8221_gp034 [African swine fever virus]AOO54339.1 hypothetical protein AFSV47Ss_0034 [African swine fever virus]QID21167.1 hypothetical protein AFSV47Ss_0034 [African swine fever virus]QIM06675.1 hypothetical protein [African swine fever virus]QIM06910.1 hypothetical protein [African swine fever virus]QIM07145.1 hypothetical protein [African swine fever virus]